MQTKNFILGGLFAGFIDFMLGWLFYGVVFASFFENMGANLLFIAIGCFSYGFFISYIQNKWSKITTTPTALKEGSIIGLLYGITGVFFNYASIPNPSPTVMILDIIITIITSAIMVVGVAFVMKRFSEK